MDRATDVAIKAVLLGLFRSKALNAHQITAVAAELAYAATHMDPPDDEASAYIAAMGSWLEKAIERERSKRDPRSRF